MHPPAMNPELIKAVMLVESGGNDSAVGDTHLIEQAYGPMQIRKPVCDDIYRIFRASFTPEQFLDNRPLSFAAFCLYTSIYATQARLGRPPTDEDRARIWNGGPNGWRAPATQAYWEKVKTYLT